MIWLKSLRIGGKEENFVIRLSPNSLRTTHRNFGANFKLRYTFLSAEEILQRLYSRSQEILFKRALLDQSWKRIDYILLKMSKIILMEVFKFWTKTC